LLWAAENGSAEAIQVLLPLGVNREAKVITDGMRALHLAAANGHAEAIRALRGAKTESTTNAGCRPLHYAAGSGHAEAIRALVEIGAKLEAKGSGATRPLHCVANGGHVGAIRVLAELGADLSARNEQGLTPWTFCILGNHVEAAQVCHALSPLGRLGLPPVLGPQDAAVFCGPPPPARPQAAAAASQDACAACGEQPSGDYSFNKCGRCKTARYCSKACQGTHWPVHKNSCGKGGR
jgi:ankyrin repeat protein